MKANTKVLKESGCSCITSHFAKLPKAGIDAGLYFNAGTAIFKHRQELNRYEIKKILTFYLNGILFVYFI